MTLASLSQNEPGGGSYEVIQDEGSDDDSYPLSESTASPDDTAAPERPKISFKLGYAGTPYETNVIIENITNVSEEENASVKIMILPDGEEISFDSVSEFMEHSAGIVVVTSVNRTGKRVEIKDLRSRLGVEDDDIIHIIAVVYTDEEEQNGYARCELKTFTTAVLSYSSILSSE